MSKKQISRQARQKRRNYERAKMKKAQRNDKKIIPKKTVIQKVKANPAGPHPFVTHYIEPLRRDNPPEEAARRLKLWKLEWLRVNGNDSTSDLIHEQEYGGKRKINVRLSEALELVDMYIDYYEEEAKLTSVIDSSHETANNEPIRIDWTGTFRQFKFLLNRLADRKYIKEPGPYQYAYIFADHFRIDDHLISERTILREIEGTDDHPRQQAYSDATRIDWLQSYASYRYLIDNLSKVGLTNHFTSKATYGIIPNYEMQERF